MSLLNKISINTIIPDLTKYYYFLQGVEKIGKTTFFRDLVLQLFNGDPTQGLLLAIGSEKGFKALDNIQVIEIETWADFVGIINELCQSKQHGIKLVGVDTYDELVELAEKEVLRLSRVENGKPCKSLNAALGGYGAGRKRLCQIVDEQLSKLHSACGLVVIGHTKIKTIKEQGTTEDMEYNVLDSNLNKDFASVVSNKADVIATGVIERQVEDGRTQSIERNLYLRSSGFVVAGSRFSAVPDKIEFNAKTFIETITEAIKNSKTTDVTVSPKKYDEQKQTLNEPQNVTHDVKQEEIEIIVEAEEQEQSDVNVEANKTYLAQIQNKFKSATPQQKKEVKQLINDNGFSKFEPDTMPTKVFEQALKIMGL